MNQEDIGTDPVNDGQNQILSADTVQAYPDAKSYVAAMVETTLKEPENFMTLEDLAQFPPNDTGAERHLSELDGGLKPGLAFVHYGNGPVPTTLFFVSKDGSVKKLPIPMPGVIEGIGNAEGIDMLACEQAGNQFLEEFKTFGFTIAHTFRDDFIGHYLNEVFNARDTLKRAAEEEARRQEEVVEEEVEEGPQF